VSVLARATVSAPADAPADARLDALPSVSLADTLRHAALQTRSDRKYLLPADRFAPFLQRLAEDPEWAVLEIDGLRRFRYSSTYFDTPDLLTYRQHRQGRRRRFKLRTRSYLDTATSTFEVKLEGARGATVKQRTPHPYARRGELTAGAREFLAEALLRGYHQDPPEGLEPAAVTAYRRITLVHRSDPARLTCDADLVCGLPGRAARDVRPEQALQTVRARNGHLVIESKSPTDRNPVDRLLRAMGEHPQRISKYCLATAALNPQLSANPWHRTLRVLFERPA
jgi:hypothetical protein